MAIVLLSAGVATLILGFWVCVHLPLPRSGWMLVAVSAPLIGLMASAVPDEPERQAIVGLGVAGLVMLGTARQYGWGPSDWEVIRVIRRVRSARRAG